MARDEINAFLGSGTIYTGDLSFEGAVRIDGIFSGNITSNGTLIVGQGAKVNGKIKVGSIVVNGNVEGEVNVTQRAVLHKTAVLLGTLTAKLLVMEEGAMLDGDLHMNQQAGTAEITVSENDEGWTDSRDSLQ